ncbi:alpha/beta hydrolase-fold protein [Mycolicibacterium neoaurum]|uniref:alpha/beta hydrolase-fold protein n=1 Tax=Mycolicibacterium neoaurum TaxID=1795 RepID=UPI003D6CEF46
MTLTIRLACALVLSLGSVDSARAHADSFEHLMVPSAAMGRDIPIAFQHGGTQGVFLLDAFDGPNDVSNWVTAGDAMRTLGSRGVSVIAPAGGGYSLYTNWEQDSGKQWETFLSRELPDWLEANKGLAPGGHAVVGAAQGGTAAMTLAAFHPDRFSYAASMSGFLYPSHTFVNGALHDGMQRFGGADTNAMWGPAQFGRWKWRDPYVHAQLLVDNGTRVWVYAPQTLTASNPAAMIGHPEQALGTSRSFHAQYTNSFGKNGHFDFPETGDHGWSSWAPELRAMSTDMITAISDRTAS